MTEQVEKMFEKLLSALEIDFGKFHKEELNSNQEKIKKQVEEILGENIEEELKAMGGKLDVDEFNLLEEKFQKQLENPIFKPYEADLKKLIEKWLLNKKNEFEHHLFLVYKVKDFPFPTVTFLTIPDIVWEKGRADRMKLNTDKIAFCGEIEAISTRTVLYAKIAKSDPLFAPHIGALDLAGYKPDASDQTPKSQNIRFIKEILASMERKSTQNQVDRYDSQYERHGEPICDFFMQNDDLKKTMKKLTSAIDSKRQNSSAAVCGIILPLITTTMAITTDESSGMNTKKLETCFEGLLKFAATTYQSPNVKKAGDIQTPSTGLTPQAPAPSSGPQLQTWTVEGLQAEAAKRAAQTQPNLPVWSEEDLIKETAGRTGVNLPTWTEEELDQERNRKMGTGMNVPDWKPDDGLVNCPKCEYTCKPEWGTCPMCDTPLNAESPSEDTAEETPEEETTPEAEENPEETEKEDTEE